MANARWRRLSRILALALLAIGAWLVVGATLQPRAAPEPVVTQIAIDAAPLAYDPSGGGILTLTGAWHLTSANVRFDSLSGLDIGPDGRFAAVTDRGQLVRFPLPGDPSTASIEDLVAYPRTGRAIVDAEAVAVDRGGRVLYALESQNALVSHAGPGRTLLNVKPAEMAGWSKTLGPETMLRLPDRRLLVVSEGRDEGRDRSFPALVYADDLTRALDGGTLFHIALADGFRPVDGKALADGTALLLARRFSPPFHFASALFVFDTREIGSAQLVTPRLVGRLAHGSLGDNYEGMALRESGDRVTIWLVSDNNTAVRIQRTLLLRLETRKSALRSLAGASSHR